MEKKLVKGCETEVDGDACKTSYVICARQEKSKLNKQSGKVREFPKL